MNAVTITFRRFPRRTVSSSSSTAPRYSRMMASSSNRRSHSRMRAPSTRLVRKVAFSVANVTKTSSSPARSAW